MNGDKAVEDRLETGGATPRKITDGGFLICNEDFIAKRRGLIGWLYRLIGNPKGWETHNIYRELIEKMDELKKTGRYVK